MMNVKIEVFEGPFELLYKMIEKQKIDIYDIPIAELTEQYLLEVEALVEKNIDNIGEFMLMAATLLKIKSRMLLPKEEEQEEDPRDELVEKLLEYKKFKEIVGTLDRMQEESSNILFKPQNDLLKELKADLDVNVFLDGVDLDTLTDVFLKMLRQDRSIEKIDLKEAIRKNIVRKTDYSIEKQTEVILEKLFKKNQISFREIFENQAEKMEMVMTFVALLELIKQREIAIAQDQPFGEIYISKKGEKNE